MIEVNKILLGDNLELMRAMPDKCVDLVFTSPPYEAARTYGVGFKLRGQDWVDWAVERFVECLRVCRGLVAWNIQGQTKDYRWSATPALFAADLHRRGVNLRNPAIFHRVGIPGSGCGDWLRSDYEWIVCATPPGKLPWSDNTAMGHTPKYAPGGAMSYRNGDGVRKNARGYSASKWGSGKGNTCGPRKANGERSENAGSRITKLQTRRKPNGERAKDGLYEAPVLANPGNVIWCPVGGGLMGSDLASENEAPFPNRLAEFFVRSFCPEGGIVVVGVFQSLNENHLGC